MSIHGVKIITRAQRISTLEEMEMALEAHVGNGYDVTATFNGALDGEPVVVAADPTVCAAKLVSYDPVKHIVVASFDHAGVVGSTEISITGDGDLGSGITGVVWTETFSALDAGATSVAVSVSAERPTPA